MKAYVLLDADVINLNFFFKSATLELSEVLPTKKKSGLAFYRASLTSELSVRRIQLPFDNLETLMKSDYK